MNDIEKQLPGPGESCPNAVVTPDVRRSLAFWRNRGIAAVFIAYIASYATLSSLGEYRWRASGEHRYGGGLAMMDLSVWRPRGIYWERRKSVTGEYIIDADFWGWFYYPLIKIDRAWIHPTVNAFDL